MPFALMIARFLVTVALFALAAAGFGASHAYAEERVITIGTGDIKGVYYPAGGSVCRFINRSRKQHGIRCMAESTGGGIHNISGLRDDEFEFAFVQSDGQYYAQRGIGEFEESGPFESLRSVFSLHPEALTILVRNDSAIHTLDQLKGKAIDIGNPGSGQRSIFNTLMKLKDWKLSNFARVVESRATNQPESLCSGKVDAIIYAAGHPNGATQEATSRCDTRLLSVGSEIVEKLIAQYPLYTLYTALRIPGGMYAGNPEGTVTFGPKATFVTSADVPDEVVYQVTKAVFENFDDFKTLHPVFSTLDRHQMIYDRNTAPLHPGALKYYMEAGLLDEAGRLVEEVTLPDSDEMAD